MGESVPRKCSFEIWFLPSALRGCLMAEDRRCSVWQAPFTRGIDLTRRGAGESAHSPQTTTTNKQRSPATWEDYSLFLSL